MKIMDFLYFKLVHEEKLPQVRALLTILAFYVFHYQLSNIFLNGCNL